MTLGTGKEQLSDVSTCVARNTIGKLLLVIEQVIEHSSRQRPLTNAHWRQEDYEVVEAYDKIEEGATWHRHYL